MPSEEKKVPDIFHKAKAADAEKKILKFWKENRIFEKSLEKPAPAGEFVFYDGPPFATGTPHYGHILASVIKDVIPRYQTMKGKRVPRQWGWDCHGLPIENIAEKELGIKRKKEIEELGIGKFNEFCRSKVLSYTEEWKKVIDRLGRWADMESAYKTMDLHYMETVWGVFKQLWDKGLIYEGYRSMHICPRCETTLSQQEVAEGYKDIKDISATVKFELEDDDIPRNSASIQSNSARTYVLAWTTTPWTLIGNVALAVNEDIDYVKVKSLRHSESANWRMKNLTGSFAPATAGAQDDTGGCYIVAKNRLNEVFKNEHYEIVAEFKGKDLIGKKYKPLFDYYYDDKNLENKENGWKIYGADFVTTDEGTGIVHIAPAFGEDDLNLGKKHNLPFIQHVGMDGIIKKEAKDFAGYSVKPFGDHQKTDIEIIKHLSARGLLFAKEKYEHSYPHCWRCETPLINYATSSWFVNVIKLKTKALELAKEINWVPEHIKEGRFGNWLEGARDWSISRQRFWASAMPIWKCKNCAEIKVIGSVDELKKYTQKSSNKYFIMRHGEAESNVQGIASAYLDKYPLTPKGRMQVAKALEQIKKQKINLIFSSTILRAKETAEIISVALGKNIIFDNRLNEANFGFFNGKPVQEYRSHFSSFRERFTKTPEGGENFSQVKNRAADFLYEIEASYGNKNILIVSHEAPIWLMFAGAAGFDLDQTLIIQGKEEVFVQNGEVKELNFVPLPHNDNFVLDLHRPYIDEIKLKCSCGGEMKRISDVLDTWFDSGSMPYTRKEFPAEFIGEGVDQTRAWFYYLHIIAAALRNSAAFKNVIVNGIVLAEDGKKMSKRLKNYPDPMEIIEKYGADALRIYLLSSPVVRAENLNFSEKGVDEAHKKVVLRLKNVLAFYNLYADKNFQDTSFKIQGLNILDEWILARLNELIKEISEALDKYELDKATRPIADFVDDLSTWYVRRSRERFKNDDKDKEKAIAVLRFVLTEISKTIAPFMPFTAEEIYQVVGYQVSGVRNLESVHLESWPKADEKNINKRLLEDMAMTRKICSLGLEARQKAGIKVRQPLASLKVKVGEQVKVIDKTFLDLMEDELNIKEIIFDDRISDEIELDTNITPELKVEGRLRELTRAIQDLRKKSGLTHQDKIKLVIESDSAGEKLIEMFRDEIKESVNADAIKLSQNNGEAVDIDELKFKIEIEK